MRKLFVLLALASVIIQTSCKKNHVVPTPLPENPSARKILLRDIVMPHLPSPYYHFEYNEDSLPVKANFASGYTIYNILYANDRISEMQNSIIVNHDTLRYEYDNAGKLVLINFISESNVNYRRAKFTYIGDQVSMIEWDFRQGGSDFAVDRTLTFDFYTDGNVKTIVEHRFPHSGLPEQNNLTVFEGYDDKINVDDFSLVHDGIHDHLFLFSGFRLQKSNPAKETFTTNGVKLYSVDYNYNYNADQTPITKKGSLLYYSGADSGKRFDIRTDYTYY